MSEMESISRLVDVNRVVAVVTKQIIQLTGINKFVVDEAIQRRALSCNGNQLRAACDLLQQLKEQEGPNG